jgi:hypothetical protein
MSRSQERRVVARRRESGPSGVHAVGRNVFGVTPAAQANQQPEEKQMSRR